MLVLICLFIVSVRDSVKQYAETSTSIFDSSPWLRPSILQKHACENEANELRNSLKRVPYWGGGGGGFKTT